MTRAGNIGSRHSGHDGESSASASRHARLGELLERVLELPIREREAFIAHACGDDYSLRDDLTSLVGAHDAAGGYFEGLAEQVLTPVVSALARPGSDTVRATMDELQARLGDRYRLERELGGAGMSRVFLATEIRLRRLVVIKVPPPEMVPAVNAVRFQREIELAAQLQHPHIVPLLTADTAGGTLYYTMPFVDGESLRDRLAREGTVPLQDAIRIWRDLLDALAHAHARGVVHRDIKPGNILLTGRHALVTDFGIAVAIETAGSEADAIAPGPIIGTPAYMAPEQVRGARNLDQRVDLYSAGVLMYEMLAGRAPFEAGSTRALLESHLTHDPPALSRSDVPERLRALVMRCLAKHPAERPQSADAVLAELDTAATGMDGVADRALQPAPVRHFRRVRRYAVVVLGLGAVVFTAGRVADARRGARAASDDPSIVSAPPRTALARRPPPDVEAYEWYRRGMRMELMRTDSGHRRGLEYFERAIALDSTYAAAYAGLVRMYLQISRDVPSRARREWIARAEQAARRAVVLDSADAEAIAALGWVLMVTRQFDAAEAALKRALVLDPAVPRGHEGLARLYMYTGKPGEQLAAARAGEEADPGSHSSIRELALALMMNGQCDEALERLRPLKRLTPPAGVAGVISGQCYASMMMWPEAIAEFRWAMGTSAMSATALLGYALARGGHGAEAREILADLLAGRRESHGAFGTAIVHAGLGDYDQAFAWLEKSADEYTLDSYVMGPMFEELRRDPRFDRLRQRIGLPRP